MVARIKAASSRVDYDRLALWIMFLSVLTSTWLLLNQLWSIGQIVTFSETKVLNQQSIFCPGDLLTYQERVNVPRTPVVLTIFTGIWETDRHVVAQYDETPVYAVVPEPASVLQVVDWLIPDLEPGNYERVISVVGEGQITSVNRIPFVIGEHCHEAN